MAAAGAGGLAGGVGGAVEPCPSPGPAPDLRRAPGRRGGEAGAAGRRGGDAAALAAGEGGLAGGEGGAVELCLPPAVPGGSGFHATFFTHAGPSPEPASDLRQAGGGEEDARLVSGAGAAGLAAGEGGLAGGDGAAGGVGLGEPAGWGVASVTAGRSLLWPRLGASGLSGSLMVSWMPVCVLCLCATCVCLCLLVFPVGENRLLRPVLISGASQSRPPGPARWP